MAPEEKSRGKFLQFILWGPLTFVSDFRYFNKKQKCPHDCTGGKARGSPASVEFIGLESWMSQRKLGAHPSSRFWDISLNMLKVWPAGGARGKVRESPKVIRIDPLGSLNICNKFHGNPSNTFQDISLWTTNVNVMLALQEKSKDHQSQ